MHYKIQIAEAAEEDIENSFNWYEDEQKNLGSKFEVSLKSGIQSIKQNPLKVQTRYKNIRVYFIDNFPFGIHFKISEDIVLIIAVFHTSRNPQKWHDRLE